MFMGKGDLRYARGKIKMGKNAQNVSVIEGKQGEDEYGGRKEKPLATVTGDVFFLPSFLFRNQGMKMF